MNQRLFDLIASCGPFSMLDPLAMCLIGSGGSALLSLFIIWSLLSLILIWSLARILVIGGSSSPLLTSSLVNFLGLIFILLAEDKARQRNIRTVFLPGMLYVSPCVALDSLLTGKQSYKVSKLSLTAAAWDSVESQQNVWGLWRYARIVRLYHVALAWVSHTHGEVLMSWNITHSFSDILHSSISLIKNLITAL